MYDVIWFYATIELTRSKLFYLQIFHSQMCDSYYHQLGRYRFLNVIIIENIPQLLIQCFYIVKYNGQHDVIVFLSMILSILSVFAAMLTNLSFCLTKSRAKSKFDNESSVLLTLKIKHQSLGHMHLFSNRTFEHIWISFFHLDEQLGLFGRLNDVHYDIETLYVSASKYIKHLCVNIQIRIFTNDKQLTEKILKTIRECDTNQLLKQIVTKSLKLKIKASDLELQIISMNVKNEDTGEETVELGKMKSNGSISSPVIASPVNTKYSPEKHFVL